LVVTVVPLVASGGAALTAPPWQLLQAAVFWRLPLMWSVVAAAPVPVKMMPPEVFTTVLWQGLQAVAAADFDTVVWTGSFGAAPWQEPQVALVVVFHCQVATEPRCAAVSDAPWQ
jgi:hypothetical protein